VKELLMGFTMRSILRMALREKWPSSYGGASAEGEGFRRALEEAFAVSGAVSNVGEWVPWLAWLDVQGLARRMRRVHAVFDRFNEQILDEHQEDRRRAGAGGFVARDLVDVLLRLAEDGRDRGRSQRRPGSRVPASRPSSRTSFLAARRPRR